MQFNDESREILISSSLITPKSLYFELPPSSLITIELGNGEIEILQNELLPSEIRFPSERKEIDYKYFKSDKYVYEKLLYETKTLLVQSVDLRIQNIPEIVYQKEKNQPQFNQEVEEKKTNEKNDI